MQADLKRREQIAAGRAGGRAGRQQGAAADSTTSGGGAVAQIPPSVAATLGPPLGLPRTAAVQVSTTRARSHDLCWGQTMLPERFHAGE